MSYFEPLGAPQGALYGDPAARGCGRDRRWTRRSHKPRPRPGRGRKGPRRPFANSRPRRFGDRRAPCGRRRRCRSPCRSSMMSNRPAEHSDGDRSTRNAAFGAEIIRFRAIRGHLGPERPLPRRYRTPGRLRRLRPLVTYGPRLRQPPARRQRPQSHRGARPRYWRPTAEIGFRRNRVSTPLELSELEAYSTRRNGANPVVFEDARAAPARCERLFCTFARRSTGAARARWRAARVFLRGRGDKYVHGPCEALPAQISIVARCASCRRSA